MKFFNNDCGKNKDRKYYSTLIILQLHIVHSNEEDNYDVVETQITRVNGNIKDAPSIRCLSIAMSKPMHAISIIQLVFASIYKLIGDRHTITYNDSSFLFQGSIYISILLDYVIA